MAQKNVTIVPGNSSPAEFTPSSITVNTGDMVVWQNTDPSQVHSPAALDGSFQTDLIQPNASSLPITFTTAGMFSYQCTQHANETGTVVVNGYATASSGAREPQARRTTS